MFSDRSTALELSYITGKLWNIAASKVFYREESGRERHADVILVSPRTLLKYGISVDELSSAIRQEIVCSGKRIGRLPLIIGRCFANGDLLVCDESDALCEVTELHESGSAATVALRISDTDRLEVIKHCASDGVDGNGRPWLRQQMQFYQACAGDPNINELFVDPIYWREETGQTEIAFPYVPGNSLAELVLCGAGERFLNATISHVVSRVASSVWTREVRSAPPGLLKKIHMDRMVRRVKLAAEHLKDLEELLGLKEIVVNDEALINFPELMDRFESEDVDASWGPSEVSLVHGDLNIHNILCVRNGSTPRSMVRLLDPRGTRLQSDGYEGVGIEPGDRTYDLGKLKFSLGGFVAVRANLLELSSTMAGRYTISTRSSAAKTLDSCNEQFLAVVEKVAGVTGFLGNHWRERTLLAEAANFLSDTACCFGRNTPHEVIPLYLLGVRLLNRVYRQYKTPSSLCEVQSEKQSVSAATISETPNYGSEKMRQDLLSNLSTSPWDVIEILIKRESLEIARSLLQDLKGTVLPSTVEIYDSWQDGDGPVKLPAIFLHGFPSRRSSLNSLVGGIRQTERYLQATGLAAGRRRRLRILSIISTGASSRNVLFNRGHDKLLMPGPYNACALQMIIQQSYQLPIPSGRWVCNNDGIFLLSRSFQSKFDKFAVVGGALGEPYRSNATALNVHEITETKVGFGAGPIISRLEQKSVKLLDRNALFNFGIYFMPHTMAEALSQIPEDVLNADLDIVNDLIMIRCLDRDQWLAFAQDTDRRGNGPRIWSVLRNLTEKFGEPEFLHGGTEAVYFHLGSSEEYVRFGECLETSPVLKSFVRMPDILACYPSAGLFARDA